MRSFLYSYLIVDLDLVLVTCFFVKAMGYQWSSAPHGIVLVV